MSTIPAKRIECNRNNPNGLGSHQRTTPGNLRPSGDFDVTPHTKKSLKYWAPYLDTNVEVCA
jgi:hypothetical protein